MKRTLALSLLALTTSLFATPLQIEMAVDLQCPFTQRALSDTVPALKKKYGNAILFIYRQFPLDFHSMAEVAARGALCAEKQGAFETYYKVFTKKQESIEKTAIRVARIDRMFDIDKFVKCTEAEEIIKKVKAEKEDMSKKGVNATPFFLVNGVKVAGNNKDTLDALISAELLKNK